ncbi:MAG: fatty acid desaturase family protein [Candidatus Binatia bacterium]
MTATDASRFERMTVQQYAREVRPHLPVAIFEPIPRRAMALPVHLAIILGLAVYIVAAAPPWYISLAAAIVAGHSWACLAFLAHETLHHAVVRSRLFERLIGYFGLGLFCLSPTLWTAWHNQAHHGNTGDPAADPDGLGTLGSWHTSAGDRALERFAPGSGHKRSAVFLLFTFSFHSLAVLINHSHRDDYYRRVSRRAVYTETAAMFAFWSAVFFAIGAGNFLFVYAVPVVVANLVAMSYIATNHFLNSLTAVNDPLVNSLSVRNPGWLERLHFQFGYHVEHHIFPTVSGRHGPVVRDALVRLYGDRYLSLSHPRALQLLYARPKLHGTADTVVDPRTMTAYSTLAPGALDMGAVGAATASP